TARVCGKTAKLVPERSLVGPDANQFSPTESRRPKPCCPPGTHGTRDNAAPRHSQQHARNLPIPDLREDFLVVLVCSDFADQQKLRFCQVHPQGGVYPYIPFVPLE